MIDVSCAIGVTLPTAGACALFTLSEKIIEFARAGAENQKQELLSLLVDALALNDGEAIINDILAALRENLGIFKELDELENPVD